MRWLDAGGLYSLQISISNMPLRTKRQLNQQASHKEPEAREMCQRSFFKHRIVELFQAHRTDKIGQRAHWPVNSHRSPVLISIP